MQHNSRKIMWIVALFACFLGAAAQNPQDVNINNLNDQQVKQIVSEVNSRGLSMDQAIELAKARGATNTQIEQLKARIQELQFSQGESVGNPAGESLQANQMTREAFTQKAQVEATPKNKKIFGFNLFNADNLTFEPSVNIPVPKNYVMGINDELTINIWGASQQTYQLTVDSNGSISIPDLGPVYVSGMDFSDAEKLIRKRLVAIYSGMGGQNPNTFAEISISNLRSIKVNVIGEVNAPGTYTLPATASAFNALYLSGGPNENGSFRNIKVIRQNKVVSTIDVYDFLIHANTANNIPLRDQDILFIPTYKKRVTTSGAFKREGYYELLDNENMGDLLTYLGGFSDNAYQDLLTVTRMTGKELKVLDVSKANFNSFIPQNGDSIVAGEIIDRYENRVSIQGAVFRPGAYQLKENMHLSQLIAMADGVKEDVFSNRGILIRLGEDLSPMTIAFDVNEVLNGKNDLLLKREDQVIIQDIFSMRQVQYIRIFGQVQNPGDYQFQDNMSLKDLIFMAGGFTEAASESFIEVARRHDYQSASKVTDQLATLHQFNISRDLKLKDDDAAFNLKPFDYVYVRRAPSYNEQRTVNILGEVVYPGPYSIKSKDERVSDLIERAGGLTPEAYTKGAILYRKNRQKQVVEQSLKMMANDSLTKKAERQLDGGDKLELRLNDILAHPGTAYDYILREGDEIMIPEQMQEVKISGEVLNPIGLAYQQTRSLKYYIERSGGFSSKAKRGKVFIIYSDGTTKVTKKFFGRKYPKPEPGCQIIVPSKPEKKGGDQTAKWLAIASAFSSIAVALSTIFR